MKHLLATLVAAVLVVNFASAADNALSPLGKGVLNSPHNLSYSSQYGGKTSSSQVCVFCHTPHNAYDKATTADLWNHTLSSVAYTEKFVSNRSSVCLSCHDGTLAVTDVRNKIWQTNVAGAVQFTGSDLDLTGHVKNNFTADANGIMHDPLIGGGTGDLTNEHPVGVAYRLSSNYAAPGSFNQNYSITGYTNGWSDVANSGSLTDPTKTPIQNWNATNTGTSGGPTASMPSMSVRLYLGTDPTDAATYNKPTIQCTSCHDVHNSNGLNKLLRMSNDQSLLCRNCHYSK